MREPAREREPVHGRKAVYAIIDREGQRSRWIRIGVAFLNRDGSWNVMLDALPTNSKLHIRDFRSREAEEGNGQEVPF